MRTNIVLDENLVAEAQRLTGIRTKRALMAEGPACPHRATQTQAPVGAGRTHTIRRRV